MALAQTDVTAAFQGRSSNTNDFVAKSPQLKTVLGKIVDALIGTGGTAPIPRVPTYTSTARNALTAAEGMMIQNSTTNKLNVYLNGAWAAVTSV